jgi:metallo-beta-lactamase family protein
MKITFLGATKNVTGSKFLVETAQTRLLVDCGMFQERAFRARNWDPFPADARGIRHVLLTHAHIDHCGYLPRLVKEGFHGKIIATEPTAAIAGIALLDAAKLQEADAEYKRKRHKKEKRTGPFPEIPLYTTKDAERVIPLFKTVSYDTACQVGPDVNAVFHDAGHILGSSMIELKVTENGEVKTIIFSGDIGRWDRPLLRDPALLPEADYVVMESTYGTRALEDAELSEEKLREVILKTAESGGNVVIPSFAIERAQEILYDIKKLLSKNALPPLPVFLDSPMAIKVTEVFKQYARYLDQEAKAFKKSQDTLFEFPLLKATPGREESKAINRFKAPCLIIAGSGMCTGGRIKHHLVQNITRPESTILFVGYQAEGTLGRQILEKPNEVRILGAFFPVRARIEKINGFSAHADKDELLRWVSGFTKPPKRIFVVHGEEQPAQAFAETLKEKFSTDVLVPDYKDVWEL